VTLVERTREFLAELDGADPAAPDLAPVKDPVLVQRCEGRSDAHLELSVLLDHEREPLPSPMTAPTGSGCGRLHRPVGFTRTNRPRRFASAAMQPAPPNRVSAIGAPADPPRLKAARSWTTRATAVVAAEKHS